MKREGFRSRIGFLLVSAGCAIGIGNVWRFPFVAGENGGGIFVLLYLIFLVIMGLPVLTMELAVGRASRKSAVLAYKALEKPGHKWHIHGWICILGCLLLMMYYTTVSGWMTGYFFKFAAGTFNSGMTAADVGGVFGNLLESPLEMGLWMAVNVILGFLVCLGGLQKGIERITKVMMTALLILILALALHSLLLPGAGEGVRFYLVPSIEKVQNVGLGKVITAAMNQSFFTLSLGVASMEIFGSYMSKDRTLPGEAATICAMDTFVAIMAGFIIFPACFSFGVQPDAGPSLIFVTLPNVFIHMPAGRLWGTLFFLFMTFASLSTVIAVVENLISFGIDMFGWKRRKSVLINGIIVFVTSIPCVLGYNLWSGVRFFGGKDILDMEDFIVSNLLLPIGALVFTGFCVWKFGWGADKYFEECNTGRGMKFARWMKYYFQYALPVLILVILIQGLI